MKRILIRAAALLLVMVTTVYAAGNTNPVINSQGTSLAPVSVTTATAVEVIPPVAVPHNPRNDWAILAETEPLRCTAGTYSNGVYTAPGTAPSSTAGFYVPSATLYTQKSVCSASPEATNCQDDVPQVEIDCIAIGGTTNVDTWEDYRRLISGTSN